MKKDIIFLSDNKIWSLGVGKGAPSFYNTLKLYCNKGHRVILLQPENAHLDTIDLKNFKTITFKPSYFYKFNNIKKIGYFSKLICHMHNKKAYNKNLRIILDNNKNSILYAYETDGVSSAKRMSSRYKMPLVTRFQGTVLSQYKLNLKNKIRRIIDVNALKTSADVCIMTNDGTRGDRVLNDLGNKSRKIMFLRNGVNLPNVNENVIMDLNSKFRQNGEIILCTLSRLVPWKKVERAIMIEKQLLDDGVNARLLIIGSGDDRARLESLVSELNMKNSVVFIGEVDHKDVYSYLSFCDIFLSLYDLSNVGNPLLEAMSVGKIIITLNVGATKNVITNDINGLIFDLDEIHNIPLEIEKLLCDADRMKKLEQNALLYAKKELKTWDVRMQEEYDVVSSL